MRASFLIIFILNFSNSGFCQIKSERQVEYRLNKDASIRGFHNNSSKDSCVIFWEEYNRNGKVTIEYDFPSDRCWKINGPWEHHYFYDSRNRIIEHRDFGRIEGENRALMRNHFYSYPHVDDPNKANEILIVYDYIAKTGIEKEIDTFYIDTINTVGMIDFFRTGWKFDTIRIDKGNFIFREDFKRDKKLFQPEIISSLLDKRDIKDFENALLKNIDKLSSNLIEIYNTKDDYSCEFAFKEKNKKKEIQIKTTDSFINIDYKFLNKYGDVYLNFHYEYYINGNELKKQGFVKSYIDYY